MRIFTATSTLLIGLIGALAFTPVSAQYDSNAERLAKLTSPTDVYYFFEGARKQVTSYSNDRVVRVCLGDSRHGVPLRVIHDDNNVTVAANECIRVEGKEIFLEPAEPLESNATIRAEVETLN
ncbi:MAG: hypothetical protein ACNS61_02865 [Candidatus Wenzhouxiangella sp. M2_3B_020]